MNQGGKMIARLKELRKTLNMNQTDFAASLGMAQTSYSSIETKDARLTDKNITLICLKFNVNETWLRTGQGPMFTRSPPGPVNDDEKRLLDMFRRLTEEMRDIILRKVREMVDLVERQWADDAGGGEKGEKKDA
jgi:transcriptional regulator with XRE-family HTH domain